MKRPIGITGLSIFFIAGALISFLSFVSLLFPNSVLERMWQLNPRARDAFAYMGKWSLVLMGVVCIACTLSAIGLWRGRRWGYRLAFSILTINLIGDLTNAILGIEKRAAIGVPIALAILVYLRTKRVKEFFEGRGLKPANSDAG
jgi:multisubunit Na+/H+ antiporter MnhF subunit